MWVFACEASALLGLRACSQCSSAENFGVIRRIFIPHHKIFVHPEGSFDVHSTETKVLDAD